MTIPLSRSAPPEPRREATFRQGAGAMRWMVGLLVTVGVVASVSRYLLPHALHQRIALPLYGSYAPEQLPVLAAHPVSEALHRLGGALYMVLGAMQLTPGLRARHPTLHRYAGRVFVALSLVAGVTGAYMALAFAYEPGERAPSVLFAAVMVASVVKAVIAIRRGDVRAHRAWMIRSFSVGLGIATIRVMAVIALHTTPWTTRQVITPIFWLGWASSLLVAELWIRSPRGFTARGA